MKKEYRTPEMEIVAFETEDIITTSYGDGSVIDENGLPIDGSGVWNDDSIDEELV